jgi:hypothetical protein
MNKILYAILLLLSIKVSCQVPYPTLNINNNLTSGNILYSSPNKINSTQTLTSPLNVRYEAGQEILLSPGFAVVQVPAFGSFNAKISQTTLNPVSFSPNGWTVGRFSRFEIGIDIPASINQQIESFLNANGGTNPYNKDQISLKGTFTSPSGNSSIRNGFYYREININGNAYNQSASQYPFRIRLAPTENGTWSFKLELFVNGGKIDEFIGSFDVIESGKRGNIHVGNYNHLVDYYGNSFFAIGQNIAFADNHGLVNGVTPNDFSLQRSYLTDLANKSGNFVRVRMDPWSNGIEVEQLGVYGSYYDNFRRQWHAYELDKFFEICESNGIYIMLSLEQDQIYQAHAYGGVGPNPYGWPNNVYSSIVPNCTDFFHNSTAISYYKQRLYYIMSRYGYSSNLGIIQIINETNGIGAGYTTNYENDPALRQHVYNWVTTEVAPYLNSFYPGHLRMTGFSDISLSNPNTATNPNSSSIMNIRSMNHYGHDKMVPKTRFDRSFTQINTGFKKPFIFAEIAISDCPGGTTLEGCTNVEFHNGIWATSMAGGFGTGLYWYDWENNSKRDHFIALKNFTDGIPFESDNFSSYYGDKNGTEWIYNVNQTGSKGFGWIHNQDFFWRTDPTIHTPCVTCNFGQTLYSAPTKNEMTKIHHLQGLKKFVIEMWGTYGNGGYIYDFEKRANIFGTVQFYEALSNGIGYGGLDPDYGFKIRRNNQSFKMIRNDEPIPNDTLYMDEDSLCIEVFGYQDYSYSNSHFWDFGNGHKSYDINPSVCYRPGRYSAYHSYRDSSNNIVTQKQGIVFLKKHKSPSISNNLTIFPNPTTGLVTIKSDKIISSIIIYDQIGTNLMTLSHIDKNQLHLELKNQLKVGIYLLFVKYSDRSTEYKKFNKI